jgi:hypothetical protein
MNSTVLHRWTLGLLLTLVAFAGPTWTQAQSHRTGETHHDASHTNPYGETAADADLWWPWALPAALETRPLHTSDGYSVDVPAPPDATYGRTGDPYDRGRAHDRNRDRHDRRTHDDRHHRDDDPGLVLRIPFPGNDDRRHDDRSHDRHDDRSHDEKHDRRRSSPSVHVTLGGHSERQRWERRHWDARFYRTSSTYHTLDAHDLRRLLGETTMKRLHHLRERRTHDAYGHHDDRLVGRWIPGTDAAYVLQVRAGDTPLAELTDYDGDRRVDAVLTYRAHR